MRYGGRMPSVSNNLKSTAPAMARTADSNNIGSLKERNLFSHIPLHSALLENMNMALFQEIKGRQADFMRQFNAGNAQGAAEVYDPDGYFMPNGHDPVKGRDGIEKYFQQDMADGVTSAQIITEEVNGSGDWAFERGSYHLDGARGTESGAYLQVWKKINGVWHIHNDCFNVIKPANQP